MERLKLRKLREPGMARMGSYLDSLKTASPLSFPLEILTQPSFSDAVSDIEVDSRQFQNRYEVASYLYDLFLQADLPDVAVAEKGLWGWLSLYYFEQLCPRSRGGRLEPGDRARWIPEFHNWRKYYRHLLAGPYRIFSFHHDKPERAMALLCGPVSTQGEVMEQLAARQEVITNKRLIEAATALYYDAKAGKNKRGAGSKGPGSPRRLADVIDQFNLTWDLYAMKADELLILLPAEFNRFKGVCA